MRSLLFVAALVIAPAFVAPGASAATADAITWGTGASLIEAAPGDTARPFTVSFRNNGSTTFSNVRATFLGADVMMAPTPGASTATLSGDFKPSDVWSARFYADIEATAIAGVFSILSFDLDMLDKTNGTEVHRAVAAPLRVTGRASLDVTASPGTIPIGEDVPVVVSVRNSGSGPAGNVQASLAPGQGLSIRSGESTKAFGALLPGQTKMATVVVRATAVGTVTLSDAISYLDAAGSSASVVRTAFIEAGDNESHARDDVAARLVEPQIEAGRTTNLTYRIWNNGTDPLRDATGQVAVSGALAVPDATDVQALGTIAPGSVATMVVHVVSDNGARGVQKVPLSVTWTRADGSVTTKAFSLASPLVGRVNAQIPSLVATVNNATLAATVRGTLTNVGNTVALGSTVQIVGSQALQLTDAVVLGDLTVNTAVPFTLTTALRNASFLPRAPAGGPSVAPSAVRDTAQVRLTWNDEYGVQRSQILGVPVTISSATAPAPRAAAASDEGSLLGVAGVGASGILAALALAALAAVARRRQGRP